MDYNKNPEAKHHANIFVKREVWGKLKFLCYKRGITITKQINNLIIDFLKKEDEKEI